MGSNFLRTNLVDEKSYAISRVMGYLKYGIREVRLYYHTITDHGGSSSATFRRIGRALRPWRKAAHGDPGNELLSI
jgi:hypothetical protein